MAADFPRSILDALLGSAAPGAGRPAADRVSAEGVSWGLSPDGAIEIQVRRLELAGLQIAGQPFSLHIGKLAFDGLVALVRLAGGVPRLARVQAATAELSGTRLQGPVPEGAAGAAGAAPAPTCTLGPLAAAHGTLRAKIVDAHLVFDADVTVPIRQGRVDFKQATVEHVGPDSRMGASRLGIYVDAPNGRSYLYQFQSAPVAGVEFERPALLRGPWASDRGSLDLQPFAEWLLRQPASGSWQGLTEQARLLFARTALSGQVHLGDGLLRVAGLQADLHGQARSHNIVGLRSQAVGSGVTGQIGSLALRSAAFDVGRAGVRCGAVEGSLTLEIASGQPQWRFALELETVRATSLQVELQHA